MNGGRLSGVVSMDALPWPWPIPASGSVPAVCLVPAATSGAIPAAAQEIYRLAYERALAATRPSRYGLAAVASRN